ncbi:MAG: adenylate kinase, partial [Oscillospiraceae bacterium]|nr:adenylate kinase [Oscillospiraceae bacterium]
DYPQEICLDVIMERRGKARTDMPWIENENEEDKDFIEFVKSFNSESRPEIIKLLEKYSDKDIIVFKNRDEADDFLNQI